MKLAGDIGRRNNDGKNFAAAIRISLEVAEIDPSLEPPFLGGFGIKCFRQIQFRILYDRDLAAIWRVIGSVEKRAHAALRWNHIDPARPSQARNRAKRSTLWRVN